MTDEHLPDRRKHGYQELEERIDDQQRANEERIRHFFRRSIIAFGVIGLACTGALIGFGVLLHEIQTDRKDFIQKTCKSQNERHDNTIATLYKISKQAQKDFPKRAAEIRKSVSSNIVLIDALAPKQNCNALVRASQGEHVKPQTTPKLSIPPILARPNNR